MSPNNPFLSPLRVSNPAAEPVPEVHNPPPHFPPPSNPAPVSEPSDPQWDLAKAMLLLAQTLQLVQMASTASSGSPLSSEGNNLELVFKARPRTFDTNEKKVTYAISYLKGMALTWFELYLLEHELGNPLEFLYLYEVFQQELQVKFGPYNITGQAKHNLENLWMADNQRITKYITQFNCLTTQVRWGC
ncbi:hypothetical protein BN946_scf184603.g9 [Trametes cinnabarina]|uniref:Retrotransposon gag domain-containing protein n=1 Tax=Pycnoporus cinnabarinus TaxID=5643 RepID=A0A060SD64_PYCCI|nr:hypothetical protein BN946_scf184603.g9 [Trametes cinnabarina]